MKSFFITIFLFFSSFGWAAEKVVLQDAFVFKVMGEIVSIGDIQEHVKKLKTLNCYYPNSFIADVFKSFYKRASKTNFSALLEQKPPYTEQQILLFKEALKYFKLKFYVQTQKVNLSSKYAKALYLVGSKNGCGQNFFDEDYKIDAEYLHVFEMELFVRTRFIPEQPGTENLAQINAARANVALFINSVSKQVEDKPLWK